MMSEYLKFMLDTCDILKQKFKDHDERIAALTAERDKLKKTLAASCDEYRSDEWGGCILLHAERERVRQACIKAVVDNCAGCGGSGHADEDTQCEYCGRQISAMNAAIKKGTRHD